MSKKHVSVKNLRFAVLAADVACFTLRDDTLFVRLIHVSRPPHFPDDAGLPGGLIRPDETAEEAAVRLLRDKAHLDSPSLYVEQLATFSRIDRDPRGRVVAVAYLALVPWDALSERERTDDDGTWWQPVTAVKSLAFDHDEVFDVAMKRLASRTTYTTLMGKLMPDEFTLTELERAYEAVLGSDLDKRNFRRKIKQLKILKKVGRKRRGGRARPAELYTFAKRDVTEIAPL